MCMQIPLNVFVFVFLTSMYIDSTFVETLLVDMYVRAFVESGAKKDIGFWRR